MQNANSGEVQQPSTVAEEFEQLGRFLHVQKRPATTDIILGLLLDGRPHYSSEFRDRFGILEYRKPITRLRMRGHNIKALKIRKHPDLPERPAYQLIKEEAV